MNYVPKMNRRSFFVGTAAVGGGMALGLDFGAYLTGSILTETIFSWPGLGRYVVKRDMPPGWSAGCASLASKNLRRVCAQQARRCTRPGSRLPYAI